MVLSKPPSARSAAPLVAAERGLAKFMAVVFKLMAQNYHPLLYKFNNMIYW